MAARRPLYLHWGVHWGLVWGFALGLSACSIDKETGVGAEFEHTEVSVSGTGMDTVVGVVLDMRFHVGAHVPDTREFMPFRAEVFVDQGGSQAPVAQVPLNRPDDFAGVLDPGETESVSFTGMTNPGAFPNAGSLLCPGPVDATIIVTFMDTTASDIESVQGAADMVTCP